MRLSTFLRRFLTITAENNEYSAASWRFSWALSAFQVCDGLRRRGLDDVMITVFGSCVGAGPIVTAVIGIVEGVIYLSKSGCRVSPGPTKLAQGMVLAHLSRLFVLHPSGDRLYPPHAA